jgi:acyl-CoA reductase-like NAD-dependent aldehyde dehydrogenase
MRLQVHRIQVESSASFVRFILREILGVMLSMATWDYPCITSVNSVVPALMSRIFVVLERLSHTLLQAER